MARSVHSECEAVLLSPEIDAMQESLMLKSLGQKLRAVWLDTEILPGSESRAYTQWVAWEAGRSSEFSGKKSGWVVTGRNTRRRGVDSHSTASHWTQWNTKRELSSRVVEGERRVEQNRRLAGSLSVFIVPLEGGVTNPREPVSRKGGHRVMESLGGNTGGTQYPTWTCQLNNNE